MLDMYLTLMFLVIIFISITIWFL